MATHETKTKQKGTNKGNMKKAEKEKKKKLKIKENDGGEQTTDPAKLRSKSKEERPHNEQSKHDRIKKAAAKERKKEIISDKRFSGIHQDPKFMKMHSKKSKVEIDSRFEHMFHDEGFNSMKAGKVDKYGRKNRDKQETSGNDLRRFYRLKEENELVQNPRLEKLKKLCRGEVNLESENDSEDTSEFEDDVDVEEDVYNPEENIPMGKAAKRLAVQNLDWDKLNSEDIFAVLSSFLPSAGTIKNVTIYKSVFGEQRLALEGKLGPQLTDQKSLTTNEENKEKANSSVEHEVDSGEPDTLEGESNTSDVDFIKLRKYEIQRLRYYFAVVEFDSVETASHIYDECDGVEFEHSSIIFDLRFIPDDMVIDRPVRDTTNQISEDYSAPAFVTKALQSSKVELSWDEDDARREKLRRWRLTGLKGSEAVEDQDLECFLASESSDNESENSETKKQSIAKFRKLLTSVGENESDEDEEQQMQNSQAGVESEGFLQDIQSPAKRRLSKMDSEDSQSLVEADNPQKTVFKDPFFMNPSNHKKRDKRRVKRLQLDKAEKRKKDMDEPRKKAELELLVMEHQKEDDVQGFDYTTIVEGERILKKNKKIRGKRKKRKLEAIRTVQDDPFAINTRDPRFSSYYHDPEFTVDRTSSQYKDTKATRQLETEKQSSLLRKE